MRTIAVSIEGSSPILLHNPLGMSRSSAGKTEIPTPEAEAEASCYWLDQKKSAVAFPADNIKCAMIQTAPQYKAGKIRLTPFIAGSIYLEPPMLSFGTAKYEIDTRRAVVQRQGILLSRARIPKNWKLKFDILVDDDFPVTDTAVIRTILEEAGRRVGIGDVSAGSKRMVREVCGHELETKAQPQRPPKISGGAGRGLAWPGAAGRGEARGFDLRCERLWLGQARSTGSIPFPAAR